MITAKKELYTHLSKLIEPDEAKAMINELMEEYKIELNKALCESGDRHFDITGNMNRGQYAAIIQHTLN